jgi:hypothetical protein
MRTEQQLNKLSSLEKTHRMGEAKWKTQRNERLQGGEGARERITSNLTLHK